MIKTGLIASYLIIGYKNDESTVKFPPLTWPPFHFHPLGDWTPHSLDIVFFLAELKSLPVACQHVVVQFYPWFKLYFLLFQTHYQPRKDKTEPQHYSCPKWGTPFLGQEPILVGLKKLHGNWHALTSEQSKNQSKDYNSLREVNTAVPRFITTGNQS